MIEQTLKKYRQGQFLKIKSHFSDFMPTIQITKYGKKTNCINITEVELEKIIKLLTT